MTNTIQQNTNKEQKQSLLKYVGTVIGSVFILLSIIGVLVAGYQHGDGSAYGTGYEIGKILRSFVNLFRPISSFGLGSIIAVLLSWDKNKSIGWAMLHGILSWFYIVYALIFKNSNRTSI